MCGCIRTLQFALYARLVRMSYMYDMYSVFVYYKYMYMYIHCIYMYIQNITLAMSVQKFFRLTNLRKLSLSENDLMRIPPNIANLTKLAELDVSKNGNSFLFVFCTCMYLACSCTLCTCIYNVHVHVYMIYIHCTLIVHLTHVLNMELVHVCVHAIFYV